MGGFGIEITTLTPRCQRNSGIETKHMLCAKIRFTISISLLVALSVTAANSQVTPTQTPTPDETVRVETEEIKINILAYDGNKKFVEDVSAEDLVVTENNILHQVTSLRRMPANIVIIMDTGGELRLVKNIEQTRRTAASLVSSLRPTNSIAIVQYADTAEVVSELTTDRAATLAAISRTKFGLGSEFLAAVRLAVEMLTRKGVENRHIVLITDGTDSTSAGAAREKSLRQLLETDINVHVVSYTRLERSALEPNTKKVSTSPKPITDDPTAMPREVAELLPNGARDFKTGANVGPSITLDRTKTDTWKRRKADLVTAESQLVALTENTNGTIVIPAAPEEMLEKSAAISRSIDGSYVVTYMPKIPLGEKRIDRYITVTSKRPDLVVQAKRRLVVKNPE